ncbi:UDP-2,3-diacylglucosamine diphosphatase LpxI [Allorhizobium sp. BGMRC 0089]|uniref:LpxI family protein n=1 Tax=Allorhizobium sonneratiae TaxID=2934936 RepID=UPI0020341214|nr:UDP-2,3-diacylglucosamine diphosphatase LpxI [Allorhizobium sonneratiae]MCM2293631.1 UDP-2,3-diacylglucosamine diphosphatase LpxI [Allorhizobium sonneratiae]
MAGRLAIIAGNGLLPVYVAGAARAAGEDPFILPLKNETDRRWDGFDHAVIGVGDMAGLGRLIKRHGIERVVLSGGVKKRPAFKEIHVNLRFLLKLPSVVRTLISGGDDAVLKMVITLLEAQGCRVVGAHEIAPQLLAETGPLGDVKPGHDDLRDIAVGVAAAEALGRLDVGQGAVVVGGRIVALEGVEGTDRMLQRVADLRAEGRISPKRRGVLVKLAKPQQDVRADLPAIGLSTVENAAKAGLAGIAVEAGRALLLQREDSLDAANRAGLFITGIEAGDAR